jgi:hypothetical protein
MDVFFDATDPTAAADLRAELAAYMGRHAEPGSDLAGAELEVGELLANVVRHAPGAAWVHVDWSGRRPRIDVHDLGPGFELRVTLPEDPMAIGGPGCSSSRTSPMSWRPRPSAPAAARSRR